MTQGVDEEPPVGHIEGMKLFCSLFTVLLFLVASTLGALAPSETARVPFDGVDLVTLIHKPAGPGPFPLVLFSHGRAGTTQERARDHVPPTGFVKFWLDRGFAVVSPVRVGYGQTGGPDREDSGQRWSSAGIPGGNPDFDAEATRAAECDLAVLDWLKTQPWADNQKIILAGQSVGGMTTVKLGSLNLPGVRAFVNFAGGGGGNPDLSPGKSGHPERLTEIYRGYGRLAKVPSLWLYAENDLYWGPTVPETWFQAFAEGGSPAHFVHTPAVPGHNGHFLITFGEDLWRQPLTDFVQSLGL